MFSFFHFGTTQGTLMACGAIVVLYFAWDFWKQTRPGYLTCWVFDASRGRRKYVRKIKEDPSLKACVIIGKEPEGKYKVDPDFIYHAGLFRIPTSYYTLGKNRPLNMLQQKGKGPDGTTDADDAALMHVATESHVAKETLESFKGSLITPTMSMILIIGAVGIGDYFLFQQIGPKLDAIIKLLTAAQAAPK